MSEVEGRSSNVIRSCAVPSLGCHARTLACLTTTIRPSMQWRRSVSRALVSIRAVPSGSPTCSHEVQRFVKSAGVAGVCIKRGRAVHRRTWHDFCRDIYDADQAYCHAKGCRTSLAEAQVERVGVPTYGRDLVYHCQFYHPGNRTVALSTILSLYSLRPVYRSVGQDASGRASAASQQGGEEPVSERRSLGERRGLVEALKLRNNVWTGRGATWSVMQS
jgi:hypothetical protein